MKERRATHTAAAAATPPATRANNGKRGGGKNAPSPFEPPTFFVLGVRVDNIDGDTALEMAARFAAHRDDLPARQILFTNVHTIHLARHDREFRSCVNRADLILPDGAGVRFAGKLARSPIRENLNGTDFTPRLLHRASQEGWSVYMLGATPEVIAACHEKLQRTFPGARFTGYHHGYISPGEESSIIEEINSVQPNILLVGFGSPLQEQWISRNAARLRVGVCLGIGGLFDFISGKRRRAPRWVRRLSAEWLFRFLVTPAEKWRRVLVEIPVFLSLVIARKIVPRSLQARLARRRAAL